MTIRELQNEIKIRGGMTVSTGTHLNYDLLNSFGGLIKQYDPNNMLLKEIEEILDNYTEDEINYPSEKTLDEISWLLNEDVFDLLNDFAPEGFYFGALEGDGSCFGFWENVEN